jgi:hypothetical protein
LSVLDFVTIGSAVSMSRYVRVGTTLSV